MSCVLVFVRLTREGCPASMLSHLAGDSDASDSGLDWWMIDGKVLNDFAVLDVLALDRRLQVLQFKA